MNITRTRRLLVLLSLQLSAALASSENNQPVNAQHLLSLDSNQLERIGGNVASAHEPDVYRDVDVYKYHDVTLERNHDGKTVVTDFTELEIADQLIKSNEDYCKMARLFGSTELLLDPSKEEPLRLLLKTEKLKAELIFTSRRLPYHVYSKYGYPDKLDLSLCGEKLKAVSLMSSNS